MIIFLKLQRLQCLSSFIQISPEDASKVDRIGPRELDIQVFQARTSFYEFGEGFYCECAFIKL